MGSCFSCNLTASNGPCPPISKFSSTAFGRKAYVEIEKQDEVKRSLLRRLDEEYYSDEEDLGLSRKKGEKMGELEMDFDGKIAPSYNLLNKDLPPSPEDSDEPPFEGMVKVWRSANEGVWMWPRGVHTPVEVSGDYEKWRAQRDVKVGGLRKEIGG
ncbi:hypothetical protein CJF30_00002328 [Rutstroemia sp. NJR-2017a BBW]|nr:hypothetical protein CJF30_00002328 [Rutstroemia sp. NJR-2017a BBW]